MSIEVTQRVEFECCYIANHELNAHRYKFEATVKGPQREHDFGTVIDFRNLRNHMQSVVWDKKFLYNKYDRDTIVKKVVSDLPDEFLAETDVDLSAENICKLLVSRLQKVLDFQDPGVTVISAKLRETSDSFASWSI